GFKRWLLSERSQRHDQSDSFLGDIDMDFMDEKDHTLALLEEKSRSRRSAIMLGGAALAGLPMTRRNAVSQASTTVTDNDILNFALHLRFLEGQFFPLAPTGMTLDQARISTRSGSGTAVGTVTVK